MELLWAFTDFILRSRRGLFLILFAQHYSQWHVVDNNKDSLIFVCQCPPPLFHRIVIIMEMTCCSFSCPINCQLFHYLSLYSLSLSHRLHVRNIGRGRVHLQKDFYGDGLRVGPWKWRKFRANGSPRRPSRLWSVYRGGSLQDCGNLIQSLGGVLWKWRPSWGEWLGDVYLIRKAAFPFRLLFQFVDGWELNGEYFPSVHEHRLPLEERVSEFCVEDRRYPYRNSKRTFRSSQNAALLQYRIPKHGSFMISVKFHSNPDRE